MVQNICTDPDISFQRNICLQQVEERWFSRGFLFKDENANGETSIVLRSHVWDRLPLHLGVCVPEEASFERVNSCEILGVL